MSDAFPCSFLQEKATPRLNIGTRWCNFHCSGQHASNRILLHKIAIGIASTCANLRKMNALILSGPVALLTSNLCNSFATSRALIGTKIWCSHSGPPTYGMSRSDGNSHFWFQTLANKFALMMSSVIHSFASFFNAGIDDTRAFLFNNCQFNAHHLLSQDLSVAIFSRNCCTYLWYSWFRTCEHSSQICL